MEKKQYYIAYGSNLNLEQMARRCPTAKVVGIGTLENYQLIFNRVATVVPEKGVQVPVGVWEIDAASERALDVYEGYPRLYRKEYLTVNMGNREITGLIYIMNTGEPELPGNSYLTTILEGYYDVGLDPIHLRMAMAETQRRMK